MLMWLMWALVTATTSSHGRATYHEDPFRSTWVGHGDTEGGSMEFLRRVDFDRMGATSERVSQTLIGHDSGASSCSVNCIKTPPGEGSPSGLHTHVVDQLFYILSGTMSLEIEGKEFEAGPGTLVVFPAGVPHRNWNGGREATVHLAINSPLPDPAVPIAQSVCCKRRR